MTPQEYIKALRAALQALVDVQNLPPQLAWKGDRQKAMAEAERVLAMEPVEKPKRYGCHCDFELVEKTGDCGIFTGYCTYGEQNFMPKA
jgi:hypothetical protein